MSRTILAAAAAAVLFVALAAAPGPRAARAPAGAPAPEPPPDPLRIADPEPPPEAVPVRAIPATPSRAKGFASIDALLDTARRGGREGRRARLLLDDVRDEAALRHAAMRWAELDPLTRHALLHALRESDPLPFVALAKEALFDADERVREAALAVLARAGDDAVDALLDHALKGAEKELAVQALEAIGTPRAAQKGLLATGALPAPTADEYRALFLAKLGR